MDNIAVINGREAMAYQGETPWHRLGVLMESGVDVAAALQMATLDWNVSLENIFLEGGKLIDKNRALVRDVDNEVLSVVGDSYVPIQNSEAFGILDTACKEFGVSIESAGALGRGERVWMLAKLQENIEPIPGDNVEGYFLVTSGHKSGIPLTARPTPIRVVCENTLNVALSRTDAIIKLRHIDYDVSQLDMVEEMIGSLIETLEITNTTFAELAKKKWSMSTIKDYVDKVLGFVETSENNVVQELHDYLGISKKVDLGTIASRRRDNIIELVFEGKGAKLAGANRKKEQATAWGAYNAVAEYYDHVRPAEFKSENAALQANRSALFGASAGIKLKALELAVAA